MGEFTVKFVLRSELGELAQLPISVFMDNIHKMTVSVQGTNGKWVEESRLLTCLLDIITILNCTMEQIIWK